MRVVKFVSIILATVLAIAAAHRLLITFPNIADGLIFFIFMIIPVGIGGLDVADG